MLKVQVTGLQRLLSGLDRLSEVAQDLRELDEGWQPHVDTRLEYERQWMDSEGAGSWEPLSEGYAQIKGETAAGFKPILQLSSRMYRSLTEESAPNFVRIESAQNLKVGSSDPKARIHHKGGGPLDARPVINVTTQEAAEHLLEFRDAYKATAEAGGFRVI